MGWGTVRNSAYRARDNLNESVTASRLRESFNSWYLDDGSLGGVVSSLLRDLEIIKRVGPSVGLLLNEDKCEIVTDDDSVVADIQSVLPRVRHVPRSEAVLLGAPVGDETSVDTVLHSKLVDFRRLASRLITLNAHDALFLLKICFGLPKLLYTLRCAASNNSAV